MSLNNRGMALKKLPDVLPADFKSLGTLVLASYEEYRANAVRWSAAYFGCVFGSATFSAAAGVLLKLEVLARWPNARSDLAALLAAMAALLVTLSTTGDFQRKWHANRTAAGAMENLAYELIKTDKSPSPDAVLEKMQAITSARTEGITGDMKSSMPTSKDDKEEGAQEEGSAKAKDGADLAKISAET